jgi:hypothetical protein
MSHQPPARAMRENPDIDQLKRQARELLDAYLASAPQSDCWRQLNYSAARAAYHTKVVLDRNAQGQARVRDR